MSSFRERAFLVCQTAAGDLVPGKVVVGGEREVQFPRHCPAGANPIAVVHTHPPDNSILPSQADMEATAALGLPEVCVIWRNQVRCYPTGV